MSDDDLRTLNRWQVAALILMWVAVALVVIATECFAVDCPSPDFQCIPACEDLSPNVLAAPPDGLGLELPQRNACNYATSVTSTVKVLNKACTKDFCELGPNTKVRVGGTPDVGVDCLKVAGVETISGDTWVTLEFAPCCGP